MKRIINKEKLIELKNKFTDIIKTNLLFTLFFISMLFIDMLLRTLTVGGFFSIKPLLADSIIILLIGLPSYLFKYKNRINYYLIWIIFFTGLSIANTVYYQFYNSYLSITLLDTSSMINGVTGSIFDKVSILQITYLIIPITFIYIFKKLEKKNSFEEEKNIINLKEKLKNLSVSLTITTVLLLLTMSGSDYSRLFKQWNREYIVDKFGIYVYTLNDLRQSLQPKLHTLYGYDEAAYKFKNFYACKWEKETKNNNEYTGIFKGKNIIFIHMESIQNFLINLKINGEEVTPNINKLASSGIYFNKFYPQISVGTSSDTEFTLLTGLMPSSSGTVFVNYFDREYYSLPKYFNKLGYYTFSTHANNADYWNRKKMHANLGYKDFFAKDTYEVPEDKNDENHVLLGLSDKSFFKQFTEKLKLIKEQNESYLGTIITLSNHSPFNDIEKYDEFKLTMPYTYEDKNGYNVTKETKYLEDTKMGNYILSSHYADSALSILFEELKKENLYENTIFIFYGDHESRLSKSQFDLLYNYNPETESILEKDDENYKSVENYNYELLKNTPLIIWSPEEEFNKEINKVMGMYDVLPTIANMFGFEEKYALGHDIFSENEGIVVFPNGNILTDKVFYNNLNSDYITFTELPIEENYIANLREYAEEILEVSNGIIVHDLIKREKDNIGECINNEKTKE